MRNVVLVAIVLALAVAAVKHQPGSSAGSGSAGTAAVTANGFLAAQHKYDRTWGDRATDEELMTVGRAICALHRRGMSDLDILTHTTGYRPPAGSKTRTLGLQRIHDARKYLCP